jgi:hypothetical protein
MVRGGLGAIVSPDRAAARTGATTLDNSSTGANDATLLAANFTGAANCGDLTVETVQHGAVLQLGPAAAESDGACPDAPMDAMASLDMPGIGASLEGRQQSRVELPSAHIF